MYYYRKITKSGNDLLEDIKKVSNDVENGGVHSNLLKKDESDNKDLNNIENGTSWDCAKRFF